MDFTAEQLPYKQTGYFTKITIDYLENNQLLRPFYEHPVSVEGIKSAIHQREKFNTDRQTLVEELKRQYSQVASKHEVNTNIDRLLLENTFTITTAHQPAVFTGTLYFIYKILHVIKIASFLSKELPRYNFVPVYYMGSEDADLEELSKLFFNGEKVVWETRQTGAVGRMNTKGLEKVIARIEGEFSVLPFGNELVQLLKNCYIGSPDVQTATFKLVHALFAEYGLIVLIPDNTAYKTQIAPIMEDDLLHQTSSAIVAKTIAQLSGHYKVQANPREINLFYLNENIRNRIEKKAGRFIVVGTDISFSENEIKEELRVHPERFSPNVILRGVQQETILPNLMFIGGGGENAYWLELKELFHHYGIPYPVLVLRNSFLIIEKKWKERLSKLKLTAGDIFKPEEELLNNLVKAASRNQVSLAKELAEAAAYYDNLKSVSKKIDTSLAEHADALKTKALKLINELEKKMLRAEKRKFSDSQTHLHTLKSALFPKGNLQERIDNFIPYYSKWGKGFIDVLYENSLAIEQKFIVLLEN
ncbi:MAG: bacillithiol biosynthesis cysteine-adding enzyme BshC [Bacteroidetes bacterium]|nr:bacillithiol biosynthesis cysteine-adding enzyme BshC [Bacteroidota bacterium]